MTVNTKVVQTPSVALYSGIAGSATSARITPYPVDLDGNRLTMSDFGTNPSFTIDPKISGSEEINLFTGIMDNGDNTATLTGLSRNVSSKYPYTATGVGKIHGAGAVVVFSDNPQLFGRAAFKDNDETITGQWTFSVFPITPSTPLATIAVYGMARLATAPASAADPVAVGNNDTRLPLADPTTLFAPLSSVMPSGIISPYAGRSAPSGWLLCDGSAVSRTTYAALFAAIALSGTATVTIASPGVFTKTAHGYVAGDKLHFTTTGALPTGLSTNTDYYVISAGLTANAFEVALSPGGAAVNTSGSQSGTHTVYASAWGKGDGSTTFNVPDLRSRVPVGLASAAPTTQTLSFEPAAVSAGSDNVTILNTVFPAQGQKVQLTSTGTLPAGLSLATDYWIARTTSTTICFSTTQANANAASPVVVNITDQGTGVHTMTYTGLAHTVLGRMGGEETHANSTGELAGHVHAIQEKSEAGAGTNNNGSNRNTANTNTGSTDSTGSDAQHNNMQPFVVVNHIIKT